MQINTPSALPQAGTVDGGRRPTLEQAASDFAAVFCQKLMKHAWKARGMMSGGKEAQAFYDQLSWEYGRIMAHRDNAGLTKMIVKSLQKTSAQKGSDPLTPTPQEGSDR